MVGSNIGLSVKILLSDHFYETVSYLSTRRQVVHGSSLMPLHILQVHQLGMTITGQLIAVHARVRHGAIVVHSIWRALRSLIGRGCVDASICAQPTAGDVRSAVEPRRVKGIDG